MIRSPQDTAWHNKDNAMRDLKSMHQQYLDDKKGSGVSHILSRLLHRAWTLTKDYCCAYTGRRGVLHMDHAHSDSAKRPAKYVPANEGKFLNMLAVLVEKLQKKEREVNAGKGECDYEKSESKNECTPLLMFLLRHFPRHTSPQSSESSLKDEVNSVDSTGTNRLVTHSRRRSRCSWWVKLTCLLRAFFSRSLKR